MSLPARSSVWSASSLPGTAGSGICFTQTTMFMSVDSQCVRARRSGRRAGRDSGRRDAALLPKPAPPGSTRGYRRTVTRQAMRRRARRRRRAGRGRGRDRGPPPRASTCSWSTRPRFPRDKTCGDGLTTGALRLLDALGVDVRDAAVVRAGHRDRARLARAAARSSLPAARRRRVRRRRATRVELDAALVDARRDAGVDGARGRRRHARCDDRRRRRRRRRSATATARRARAGVDRRRRPLLRRCAACSTARPTPPDLGDVARVPPVLPRRRRPPALGAVRATTSSPATRGCSRSADGRANVGFGVLRDRHDGAPTARQLAAQWRDARSTGPSVRARPRPDARARRHRTARGRSPRRTTAARLAHGRVLFVGRRRRRRRPDDRRGHRAGARDRACSRRARSPTAADAPPRSPRATAPTSTARSARDLRFAALAAARCCASPLGARAAIARRRRSRRGRAATSPAGCSRTIPRALALTPDRWRRGMFTPSRSVSARCVVHATAS